MSENTNTRSGLRLALPVAALAALVAVPVVAAAASEPPFGQGQDQNQIQGQGQGQAQGQTQGQTQQPQAAPVPCTRGAGDDALVRAIRAGGRIALQPDCTYTVTKRHGPNSALPPITRDTTIEGRNSFITWGGKQRVPSLLEIAGENVRLVLRGVTLRGGRGVATIRARPGSSSSVKQYGSDQAIDDSRTGKEAEQLVSWLAPALTGRK
jgi:hypothetical protein